MNRFSQSAVLIVVLISHPYLSFMPVTWLIAHSFIKPW
jgi:hypothetical protein